MIHNVYLEYTLEEIIKPCRKIKCNGRGNEVNCVMDRNFFDTIIEFEKQLESTQLQFRALKEFVAIMVEEREALQQENTSFKTTTR